MIPDRADRVAACLLGGAIGDALGAPVEFMQLARIRDRYGADGIRDFDRAYGRIGAITDDTQMTLFTAEGLLRWLAAGKGTESEDPKPYLYRAYLRWLETQGDEVPSHLRGPEGWLLGIEGLHSPRAPGNCCLTSLRSGEMGSTTHLLNHNKGCGGVMRAAPAGLIGASDPFQLGVDAAAITHSHPTGYLSAGFLAQLINEVMAAQGLHAAVDRSLSRLEGEEESEETVAAVQSAMRAAENGDPGPETIEQLGGGWIAEEALGIALYCALSHPNDFEAAVLLAVNHSGDTDSTGAITGNIVGAHLGTDALPVNWLERLELYEEIAAVAQDIATRFLGGSDWAQRYPVS